jgi:hypothetical protein
MTLFKGFVKALAAGAAAGAVLVVQHLIAFFQGAQPSDVSNTLWLAISFVGVLAANYLIGKIPAPSQ